MGITSLGAAIVALVAIACSDSVTDKGIALGPAFKSMGEGVANYQAPALRSMSAPQVRVVPRSTALAITAPAACTNVLIYDENTISQHAMNAARSMGLSFTRAGSGLPGSAQPNFITTLTGSSWDLVILDLPSNEPAGDWQTPLINYIQGGGRVIHSHWNSGTLTSGLQAAFEIGSPVAHNTVSFFQWNSHSLFTTPNAVPSAFDVWSDVWGTNGFDVEPTGSAVAAAGTTTEPSEGKAAIVIGNDGRTIFNGFLFDDYQPADKDADEQKDIEELIQNEIVSVCGSSPNETTERVPAGEAATVAVEQDGNGDGDSSPVVAVDIPAGTFDQDVDVTVRLVETAPGAPCHDYLIGQIGKCVEITATNVVGGGEATLHVDLTIGVCLPEHLHLEMFKFENAQDRARPLQQVEAPFLDCSDLEVASAKPRNWLEGLAMAVSKRVGKWITPKSAYAADRGFGGRIDHDLGLSFFTWASPIQLSYGAVLGVNVLNSGKDAYAVSGRFGTVDAAGVFVPFSAKDFDPFLGEAGFDPLSANTAANTVIVAFGAVEQSIAPSSFKKILGRWVYTAPFGTTTGVKSLIINPLTGNFIFAGSAPTEGLGTSPLATYRPFSIQIGHRIQGGGLECGVASTYKCTLQH